MTVADNIYQYVQILPSTLQREVLNFIEFLLFKQGQTTQVEPSEEATWSALSLDSAMFGMEDEATPVYTTQDLKVVFS
jgi:hypothetical protein